MFYLWCWSSEQSINQKIVLNEDMIKNSKTKNTLNALCYEGQIIRDQNRQDIICKQNHTKRKFSISVTQESKTSYQNKFTNT